MSDNEKFFGRTKDLNTFRDQIRKNLPENSEVSGKAACKSAITRNASYTQCAWHLYLPFDRVISWPSNLDLTFNPFGVICGIINQPPSISC